ncbi:peptide ABC transporter substrate-binding protein [Lichenicoccus sp.]|uniref:peptide ABC transporter substrate-binding protein n=1 Tax=Lichenicoccus sp. TaxID=2781899 RepID=UPI003D12290B
MKSRWLLLALILFVPCAARASACGTVVLPPGIGQDSPSAVTSLDWLLSGSIYNTEAYQQIYRPLVWLDRNLNYDPSLSVASAVRTTDGGRTWLLTLKPWVWSDGVPLTARDVVFTFDLIRRIGPGYVQYDIGGIPNLLDKVVALSPHLVEIQLTKRVNPDWFLRLGLGNTILPLPEHVYHGLSLVALRARQTDPSLYAVSDGPFLVKDWDVARHLVLVPNPRFGGQHPAIKRLVFDFLQGGNALQALRAGETDAANVPFQLWNLARSLPGFRTVPFGGPLGFMSIILNFRSHHAPFLTDVRVRQAIAVAIDQKEIIRLAFHGQAQEIHSPVPKALTGFLSPAARAGYKNLAYDPRRAGALLDAAGWKLGPDGIRTKNGGLLAFDVAVSSGGGTRLIELQIVQRNLRAVGIAMSLRGIEFNQLLATLEGNGHDWDGIVISWTVVNYPDVQQYFATDGAENYGHYHDARMDKLTDAVITQPGNAALYAAQDYAAEQQPFIFLPDGQQSGLVRDGLHGIGAMASPNGTWAPELLSLSGALACRTETAAATPAP